MFLKARIKKIYPWKKQSSSSQEPEEAGAEKQKKKTKISKWGESDDDGKEEDDYLGVVPIRKQNNKDPKVIKDFKVYIQYCIYILYNECALLYIKFIPLTNRCDLRIFTVFQLEDYPQ